MIVLLFLVPVALSLPTPFAEQLRCTGETPLIEHPTDCNAYFECKGTEFELVRCPPGLHFNPVTHQCDLPSRANCTIQETVHLNDCESGDFDILPHPSCSMFYTCKNGVPKEEVCPFGQHFSPVNSYCDFPFYAGCTEGEAKEQPGAIPHTGEPTTQRPWSTDLTRDPNQPSTTAGGTWSSNPSVWTTNSPTTKGSTPPGPESTGWTDAPSVSPSSPPPTISPTFPTEWTTTRPPTEGSTPSGPGTTYSATPTEWSTLTPPITTSSRPETTPTDPTSGSTAQTEGSTPPGPETPAWTIAPTGTTSTPSPTVTQPSTVTTNPATPATSPNPPEGTPQPPANIAYDCLANSQSNVAVHLPHPDCNKFYVCDWATPVERQCPGNLHFNIDLQVCDHPAAANCVPGRAPIQREF